MVFESLRPLATIHNYFIFGIALGIPLTLNWKFAWKTHRMSQWVLTHTPWLMITSHLHWYSYSSRMCRWFMFCRTIWRTVRYIAEKGKKSLILDDIHESIANPDVMVFVKKKKGTLTVCFVKNIYIMAIIDIHQFKIFEIKIESASSHFSLINLIS